jgi:hypothetical protein
MKVFTQTLFRHEFITLDGLRLQMVEVRLILPQPVIKHLVGTWNPEGAAIEHFESSLCKGVIDEPEPRAGLEELGIRVSVQGGKKRIFCENGKLGSRLETKTRKLETISPCPSLFRSAVRLH